MNNRRVDSPMENDMDLYRRDIRNFPVLTEEEQKRLLVTYHNIKCTDAFQVLIKSNLSFVVKIALKYKWSGLPVQDLIQEGNVGLIKAINKFNINVGVKLLTYAEFWIRDQIQQYVNHNQFLVRPTCIESGTKIQKYLKKTCPIDGPLTQEYINSVASDLNVPIKDVKSAINKLNYQEIDIDYNSTDQNNFVRSAITNDDIMSNLSTIDLALIYEFEQLEKHKMELIDMALNTLNERSQSIIKDRWFGEKTPSCSALSNKYNVSRATIANAEKKAIKQMRRYVKLSSV